MHEIWPGADLTGPEPDLLKKAIEPDLRSLENDCEKRSTFADLAMASISLGSLGKGIIVLMSGSCVCGVTGNCPIYLYVRAKGSYANVLGGAGWAFGLIDSKNRVPDLVLASNAGGGHVLLRLYRYSDGKFAHQNCEMLTAKNGEFAPKNWWDPSEVSVQPSAGD